MKYIYKVFAAALVLPAMLASALFSSAVHAETIAITGGRVHTIADAGVIENGTVLIRDGKIVAVGADIDVPGDAVVIDAGGKEVTPGIFDAYTRFGVEEVSLVAQTVDAAQSGNVYTASFDISYAINPRSILIPINRIEGITRAAVVPDTAAQPFDSTSTEALSSIISGQGAVINLGDPDDWLTRSGAAMFVELGEDGGALSGGSRATAMVRLRDALEDANDYSRNRRVWEQGARRDYSLSRKDLDAMQPVIEGSMPLVVLVDRASDIEQVLKLKEEFGLKLVIASGAEAWMVADKLAAAEVPLILDPLTSLPETFASLNSTLENAARLEKAGVMFAMVTRDMHNSRNVTQYAGLAVANGLSYEAALRAITVNPARIYGVDDVVGTLEAGKDADVVVWSGDPLEVTTFADHVIIRGKQIPMVSRSTLLRDRYMELDTPRPPAYTN